MPAGRYEDFPHTSPTASEAVVLGGAGRSSKTGSDLRFCVVEPTGLEPVTPCLQSRCATNCAKAPGGPPLGESGPNRT